MARAKAAWQGGAATTEAELQEEDATIEEKSRKGASIAEAGRLNKVDWLSTELTSGTASLGRKNKGDTYVPVVSSTRHPVPYTYR